jgi:hypothetical protein
LDSKELSNQVQKVLHADIGKHLPNPLQDIRSIHNQLESFENPAQLRLLLEAVYTIWVTAQGRAYGSSHVLAPAWGVVSYSTTNSLPKQHLKQYMHFHRHHSWSSQSWASLPRPAIRTLRSLSSFDFHCSKLMRRCGEANWRTWK